MNAKSRVNRLAQAMGNSWRTIGITLLLLLFGLEMAVQITFGVRSWIVSRHQAQNELRRLGLTDWATEYQSEFRRSERAARHPYLHWRRQPFAGRYINIDDQGLRLTVQKDLAHDQPVVQIFLFGGSTMWGSGARDIGTIPSQLASLLQAEGVNCQITNYGESGYVSYQSLLTLVDELRAGRRPDVVVFYDGVNDTYSAYQNLAAGLPQNEIKRELGFQLAQQAEAGTLLRSAVGCRVVLMNALPGLVRLTQRTNQGLKLHEQRFLPLAESLATDVVMQYCSTIEVVRSLSRQYGFRAVFVWQPLLHGKTHLAPIEQEIADGESYPQEFFRQVYDLIQQDRSLQDSMDFVDLAGVFANEPTQTYIDWCHLNEFGNRVIAQRLKPFVSQATVELINKRTAR